MPINITPIAAKGTTYADIRVGECQVHQIKLDPTAFNAHKDAGGALPVGLPVLATGLPVSAPGQAVAGLIGPESVVLQGVAHFGNCFISGSFNRDMIEDNIGRALTADELAGIAGAGTLLKLIN